MKFIYILSGQMEVIEVARINSERFSLLQQLLNFDLKTAIKAGHLISIVINTLSIEKLLEFWLEERKKTPLDIPQYEGRFTEEEIFETKEFKGETLKLCNSGSDNIIIFLINLYNSTINQTEMERPHYLLFLNNHREYNEWLNFHRNSGYS